MRKLMLDVLFPKIRGRLLEACLLNPEQWWYLSNLAKHLKTSPSSLQREIASLTSVDILETKKESNRIYYRANMSCPGVVDLQSLITKTSGLPELFIKSLKKHLNKIEILFIFGSYARGEAVGTSDIDLFIVGKVKQFDLISDIKKIEKLIDREVNFSNYLPNEFVDKYKKENSFIMTVMNSPKIFLKGNEKEIEKILG